MACAEQKSLAAGHFAIFQIGAPLDALGNLAAGEQQARQHHPEYFTEGTVRPVDYHI